MHLPLARPPPIPILTGFALVKVGRWKTTELRYIKCYDFYSSRNGGVGTGPIRTAGKEHKQNIPSPFIQHTHSILFLCLCSINRQLINHAVQL